MFPPRADGQVTHAVLTFDWLEGTGLKGLHGMPNNVPAMVIHQAVSPYLRPGQNVVIQMTSSLFHHSV